MRKIVENYGSAFITLMYGLFLTGIFIKVLNVATSF